MQHASATRADVTFFDGTLQTTVVTDFAVFGGIKGTDDARFGFNPFQSTFFDPYFALPLSSKPTAQTRILTGPFGLVTYRGQTYPNCCAIETSTLSFTTKPFYLAAPSAGQSVFIGPVSTPFTMNGTIIFGVADPLTHTLHDRQTLSVTGAGIATGFVLWNGGDYGFIQQVAYSFQPPVGHGGQDGLPLVPEPSTWCLLLTGLALIWFVRLDAIA